MQIKFPTVEDVKEDISFVNKVLRFKWPLLGSVSLFLAISVFIASGGSRRMSKESDFFSISQSVSQLRNGDADFNESKLMKLVKSYPEVYSDIDYILRDELILEGKDASAVENRIVARLQYLHPFYLEHMAIVQLIGEKKQVEARDRASILMEKIEKEGTQKFPNLYTFVLARYGYLQGELGFGTVLSDVRGKLRDIVYGDPSILGSEAQHEMQVYMESDKDFFSKFFD